MTGTWDEIDAAEEEARVKYETETIGTVLSGGREVKIAELRAAFDLLGLGGDWKRPFSVLVPAAWAELVQEAVTFYHGVRPHLISVGNESGLIRVTGDGYAG